MYHINDLPSPHNCLVIMIDPAFSNISSVSDIRESFTKICEMKNKFIWEFDDIPIINEYGLGELKLHKIHTVGKENVDVVVCPIELPTSYEQYKHVGVLLDDRNMYTQLPEHCLDFSKSCKPEIQEWIDLKKILVKFLSDDTKHKLYLFNTAQIYGTGNVYFKINEKQYGRCVNNLFYEYFGELANIVYHIIYDKHINNQILISIPREMIIKFNLIKFDVIENLDLFCIENKSSIITKIDVIDKKKSIRVISLDGQPHHIDHMDIIRIGQKYKYFIIFDDKTFVSLTDFINMNDYFMRLYPNMYDEIFKLPSNLSIGIQHDIVNRPKLDKLFIQFPARIYSK